MHMTKKNLSVYLRTILLATLIKFTWHVVTRTVRYRQISESVISVNKLLEDKTTKKRKKFLGIF